MSDELDRVRAVEASGGEGLATLAESSAEDTIQSKSAPAVPTICSI